MLENKDNMKLSIQPDGDKWMVAITSHAGVNPVGPRLWKEMCKHTRPLPTLDTRKLERDAAEAALVEWVNFLKPVATK